MNKDEDHEIIDLRYTGWRWETFAAYGCMVALIMPLAMQGLAPSIYNIIIIIATYVLGFSFSFSGLRQGCIANQIVSGIAFALYFLTLCGLLISATA
jgi:hypothetical protein